MTKALLHSSFVCPDMDRTYPQIVRGQAARIFDAQGRHWIDGSSGTAAASNLGHGLREIGDLVQAQMQRIALVPTHAFISPVLESYLHQLVAFAGGTATRAWLVNSGTEAVENALKLALQYQNLRGETGRHKIIARWGSYHGNSIFMLDVGGMRIRRKMYGAWLHNFPHVSPAYAYRGQGTRSNSEYSAALAEELEATILREGPASVAALVLEPVVAAALGAVPPPQSYMRLVREICDRYGILLVADEVLTGFGRTGKAFAMQHWGVEADITACGKGISAGYYPLSAVIATRRVAHVLEAHKAPFCGGHTYSCNPVGATVGAWVLAYMARENVLAVAEENGRRLMELLEGLRDLPHVGDVRGMGMLAGIELVLDKDSKTPFPAAARLSQRIGQKAVEKGVVVYPGRGSVDGLLGDHVMLCPPLNIGREDLAEIVRVLGEAISEAVRECRSEVAG